jgi:hypothetical protein
MSEPCAGYVARKIGKAWGWTPEETRAWQEAVEARDQATMGRIAAQWIRSAEAADSTSAVVLGFLCVHAPMAIEGLSLKRAPAAASDNASLVVHWFCHALMEALALRWGWGFWREKDARELARSASAAVAGQLEAALAGAPAADCRAVVEKLPGFAWASMPEKSRAGLLKTAAKPQKADKSRQPATDDEACAGWIGEPATRLATQAAREALMLGDMETLRQAEGMILAAAEAARAAAETASARAASRKQKMQAATRPAKAAKALSAEDVEAEARAAGQWAESVVKTRAGEELLRAACAAGQAKSRNNLWIGRMRALGDGEREREALAAELALGAPAAIERSLAFASSLHEPGLSARLSGLENALHTLNAPALGWLDSRIDPVTLSLNAEPWLARLLAEKARKTAGAMAMGEVWGDEENPGRQLVERPLAANSMLWRGLLEFGGLRATAQGAAAICKATSSDAPWGRQGEEPAEALLDDWAARARETLSADERARAVSTVVEAVCRLSRTGDKDAQRANMALLRERMLPRLLQAGCELRLSSEARQALGEEACASLEAAEIERSAQEARTAGKKAAGERPTVGAASGESVGLKKRENMRL